MVGWTSLHSVATKGGGSGEPENDGPRIDCLTDLSVDVIVIAALTVTYSQLVSCP